MVEIVSALAGHLRPGRYGTDRKGQGVTLREVTGRDLVQVAAWRGTLPAVKQRLSAALGVPMPEGTRAATASGQITVLPIAPDKLWIAAPRGEKLHERLSALIPIAEGVVTELGHARTVVRMSGPSARDILARNFAVDLHPDAFPPGSFASSSMHHVGTLLHYVRDLGGDPIFDLYLTRSFALSLFEGLCENALAFGYTIET